MKNFLFFCFLSLLVLIPSPSSARDNVNYWYIKDYQVVMDILNDDTALVTENILADCGSCRNKYGIFRIIANRINTPDGSIYTPIELISITDFENKPYNFQSSRDGNTITWKIGSSNTPVQGENGYRIVYKVSNIIRDQVDYDELYWNILGTFWDIEIDNFTAIINFPEPLTKNEISTYYYSGKQESKDNQLSSAQWLDASTLEISSIKTFKKNEGITVSASFNKGYINHLDNSNLENNIGASGSTSSSGNSGNPLASYFSLLIMYGLVLPVFALIASLIAYRKYIKKNHFYRMTTVTQFDAPDNLSPILMGLMMNNLSLKPEFITATIVRFATLNLLKIEEGTSKILFIKQTKLSFAKLRDVEDSDKLDDTEKYVFKTIFSNSDNVTVKELQTVFRYKLSQISKVGVDELKSKGYVLKKMPKIKKVFLVLFIISLIGFNVPLVVIFIVFYLLIPTNTELGQEFLWKLKGFKTYMSVAETERHVFYEKENIFTKLLPYSIVFGTIGLWIKKMKDIYGEEYIKNSMYWYSGASVLSLGSSIEQISQNISKISSQINSSTGTSSGSGGSGFSGGGSGGGGGGGW